jgi:hypothetical protein
MTSELTPAYDNDTGQVVLEGLPAGPAGEALIVPVTGLQLAFDRADGRLFRVVADTGQPGCPPVLAEATAAILISLFGPSAPAEVTQAKAQCTLHPDEHLLAICSRLARLETARGTSPVPTLPLWAAEAAQLAEQAGLHDRARAEARRAICGLVDIFDRGTLPEAVSAAALAVADIAEEDDPDAAKQLRDRAEKLPAEPGGPQPGGPQPGWPRLAGQASAPEPSGTASLTSASEKEPDEKEHGPRWSLDRGYFPEGLLLPGLSPLSDLFVHVTGGRDVAGGRDEEARVIVKATLAPGADRRALSRCRARLVDPAVRRVLASAPFAEKGSWAWAELRPPLPVHELKETWVEVVDDDHRPVQSQRARRIRRALRWADAALRAEQHPTGLAPQFTSEDWAALAAGAWEHCAGEWHVAGDADRAYLATRRLAVHRPSVHVPKAPSAEAAVLADRPQLSEPAFLAEALGP